MNFCEIVVLNNFFLLNNLKDCLIFFDILNWLRLK